MRDKVSPRSLVLAHAAAGGPASSPAPTSSALEPKAFAAPASPNAIPPKVRVFDHPPASGVERFRVAYIRVRLSSAPDDLRSTELGRLDRGDEVELVDSFEGYLLVRTPTGVTGWIRRNALARRALDGDTEPGGRSH
jgi:hypothetical protein